MRTVPGKGPIRVLVVDERWLVRLGVSALLRPERNIVEVPQAAATLPEALCAAREHEPDVVLTDLHVADGGGIEACRRLLAQDPRVRVILWSSYVDEDDVVAAVLAGASGFLRKDCPPERVIEAIHTVATGGSALDMPAVESIVNWIRGPSGATGRSRIRLSEQERRILPLIAAGKTNREIGAELYLTESTVKTYVSHLLKKLHLARRSEAAAYIARKQLARVL
jgi:two-component system, NarL family, response regulator DevR